MELKKMLAVLIPLFIAAIFISSYIENANFSNQQTQQTTTIPQTVYGIGVANGIITGYGSPISITVACSNSVNDNSTVSNLTSILTNMENNNSISDFYNSNLDFQVASGNMSSYDAYTYIEKNSNSTQFGCLNFTGPAYIYLPPAINFTIGAQKYQIPVNSSYRNASISLSLSNGIHVPLRIKISSLITVNGTLYGPLGITIIHTPATTTILSSNTLQNNTTKSSSNTMTGQTNVTS